MSDPSEPHTFQQAWWHPDLEARDKWCDGIKLEFNKMISMGVWRKVGSTNIPSGRRLVRCCCVFKIKRNGVYCVRLVAKEFSQIPALDFTDKFSPVVNDVTIRVVLKIVDMDNAFLNGELEHEIYMTIPEGYAECVEQFEEKEA